MGKKTIVKPNKDVTTRKLLDQIGILSELAQECAEMYTTATEQAFFDGVLHTCDAVETILLGDGTLKKTSVSSKLPRLLTGVAAAIALNYGPEIILRAPIFQKGKVNAEENHHL